MSLFKGAGVALVTPFRKDKSIDYEELGRLLEYQIAGNDELDFVDDMTKLRFERLGGLDA